MTEEGLYQPKLFSETAFLTQLRSAVLFLKKVELPPPFRPRFLCLIPIAGGAVRVLHGALRLAILQRAVPSRLYVKRSLPCCTHLFDLDQKLGVGFSDLQRITNDLVVAVRLLCFAIFPRLLTGHVDREANASLP